MKDSISIRSILLQYKAECNQGLNELAGNGTAEEQAETQLLQLLESKAEAFVRSKMYKVHATKDSEVSEMMGNEIVQAIPLSALNELRSK